MACMCGDTHCNSCGPAQGNYKCRVCKLWTDDGGCEDSAACNAAEAEMNRLEGLRELEDEVAYDLRQEDYDESSN